MSFEDDDQANEAFRQALLCTDRFAAGMKRTGAAAAMLFAGKPGRALENPEPIVQVGFEPDEAEMSLLVRLASREGRDLVHVSCHPDGHGGPTGMIAIVFFENGKPRAHRRCGLLCEEGSSSVFLGGVSDVEDEPCRFVFRPGRKMLRIPGLDFETLGRSIDAASEQWVDLIDRGDLGDCTGERVRFKGSIDRL